MGDNVSLLDRLSDNREWDSFLAHKKDGYCPESELLEISELIRSRGYEAVAASIRNGSFPLPEKKMISKISTNKKRAVYVYPREYTLCLKLLTYLMLRKYDRIFTTCLYSFRPGIAAKDAILKLRATPEIGQMYSYKADISDYFNSIDIERLLPELRSILADDPQLFEFIVSLLREPRVVFGGKVIEERKGIMAGTPISSFLANVYLMDMDTHFAEAGITYARYSDDIIIFADHEEELRRHISYIHECLALKGLVINPDKECYSRPHEKWVFLGISYEDGVIDIAPTSVRKIKGKMRRKARSLMRWGARNDVPPEKGAKAFVRIFNRKLLETSEDRDLTWSYWYFPVINTDESLKEIDHYAQECLRFMLSGRRTKARFNVRYEDLKALGYRSLVNEYHRFRKSDEHDKELSVRQAT